MKKYVITLILVFIIIFTGLKSCNLITKRKINYFSEQITTTHDNKSTEESNMLIDEVKDNSSSLIPEFRYYGKERDNEKFSHIQQIDKNTELDSVLGETLPKQIDKVSKDNENEELSNELSVPGSNNIEENTSLYQAFKTCKTYESSYDGKDKNGVNIRYRVSIEPIKNTQNCSLRYNATKWDNNQTYESVRKAAAASAVSIFSKEMDPCFICEFSPDELESFYESLKKRNMQKSHNTVSISFVGMNFKGEKIYESQFYFRNFDYRDLNLVKTIIENKRRCEFGFCCFGKECRENAYKKYN